MPLSAGPFILQPDSIFTATAGVYDFTDDAVTLGAELDAMASSWDDSMLALEALSVASDSIDLFPDIDSIWEEVTNQAPRSGFASIDDLADPFNNADDQLNIALSFAPAAAWVDPAAQFVPPDSNLTLTTPQVDTSAYIAPPSITVGTIGGGGGTSLALYNNTRPGSANFTVGDDYLLKVLGEANADVNVQATFNGQQLPLFTVGQTDENGKLEVTGTEGPDAVGAWVQQWYIGGQMVAIYSFIVAPAQT